MPVRVLEYLGRRTDAPSANIIPTVLKPVPIPTCPFSGALCSKLKKSRPDHPVCSVRDVNNVAWVVCTDRFPAIKGAINATQTSLLFSVASEIFPGISAAELAYGPQRIHLLLTKPRRLPVQADLTLIDTRKSPANPARAIIEVQAGGETANTGDLTAHVTDWLINHPGDPKYLGQLTGAGRLQPIPNNAWKRQVGQVFLKASLALRNNGAFALVVGTLLYDYFQLVMAASDSDHREGWEIAILELSENTENAPVAGAVPFGIRRTMYMSYEEFVSRTSNPPIRLDLQHPFEGAFPTLTGELVRL